MGSSRSLGRPRLEFCILHCDFCPFYKGFENFLGVLIQPGVAKNLLLPTGVA